MHKPIYISLKIHALTVASANTNLFLID